MLAWQSYFRAPADAPAHDPVTRTELASVIEKVNAHPTPPAVTTADVDRAVRDAVKTAKQEPSPELARLKDLPDQIAAQGKHIARLEEQNRKLTDTVVAVATARPAPDTIFMSRNVSGIA